MVDVVVHAVVLEFGIFLVVVVFKTVVVVACNVLLGRSFSPSLWRGCNGLDALVVALSDVTEFADLMSLPSLSTNSNSLASCSCWRNSC